jgi:hypothetical protein
MSNKRLLLLLILAASPIVGCNNAFFEIDTEVKLIEGSYPPSFKITGNGSSPIFLMFGPYEGDYGKDGNPLPLWELDPKPDAQGIEVNRYSPFTYGQIPIGYRQNKPKDDQPPKLLEGKEYHFYVHVNSANGSGVCFRIQDQKAVKCR